MSLTPKTALVLDALPGIGGAEKVLIDALELFPDAPVYTLLYNRRAFAGTPLAGRRVITSLIDRLPHAYTHYRKYLPLMPWAIEQFDLSDFELVLSFSYAVAHGVRVRPGQTHLSYTLTPMRYAWSGVGLNGVEKTWGKVWDCLFAPFRRWDLRSIAHVDRFAAVSRQTASRVRWAYRRESTLIYPSVQVERFSPRPDRLDYYITVSRLVAHKRVDLMVEAFNRLGLPLLVVGEGPERARLQRRAKDNIRFLGFQPDQVVADLLCRARAYICAGNEDFGIAVVEAQAAGCPVIAYRAGGALETVVEDQSGIFFNEPTADSLAEAVLRFERCRQMFCPDQISSGVQRFNKRRFLRELAEFCSLPVP